MPFTSDVTTLTTDMWEFDDSRSPEAIELTNVLRKFGEESMQYRSTKEYYDSQGMHFFVVTPEDAEQPPYVAQQTSRALALQKLLSDDTVDAYEACLQKFTDAGYQFALTKGVVHERFSKRNAAGPDVRKMQTLFDKIDKSEYEAEQKRYAEEEGKHFIDVNGHIYERMKQRVTKTEPVKTLKALIKAGDEAGYTAKLDEYQRLNGLHFFREGENVFQLKDQMNQGDCLIRFQVKNQVINWYFIAPMDETTQAFRDELYESAALAHSTVDNGCESYYRGTNHYHLRAMHTSAKESFYNHNHYRTSKGSITPREVYQHLSALNKTITPKGYEGGKFVDDKKLKELVQRYTLYWSEYSQDVRYSMFLKFASLSTVKQDDPEQVALALDEGSKFACNIINDIAVEGRFTPSQVVVLLDDFIKPDEIGQVIPLKILQMYQPDATMETLKELVSEAQEAYLESYAAEHPDYTISADMIGDFEPMAVEAYDSSTLSPSKYSPRQRFLFDRSEQFDAIDQAEFAYFSPKLIQKCRSITNHHLGQLTPPKFRKAMLLYNILRVIKMDADNEATETPAELPSDHIRIHDSIVSIEKVQEMIKELPALMTDSTEDELGETLITGLVSWLKDLPADFEEYVEHVAKEGSRGMGSSIAQVRQASGAVNTTFVAMDDGRAAHQDISPHEHGPAVKKIMGGDIGDIEIEAEIIEKSEIEKLIIDVGRVLAATITNLGSAPPATREIYAQRHKVLSSLSGVLDSLKGHQSEKAIIEAMSSLDTVITANSEYNKSTYSGGGDMPPPTGTKNGPGRLVAKFKALTTRCLTAHKETHVAIDQVEMSRLEQKLQVILGNCSAISAPSEAVGDKIAVAQALKETLQQMRDNPMAIEMSTVVASLDDLCSTHSHHSEEPDIDGPDKLTAVIEDTRALVGQALEIRAAEASMGM